MTRINLVEPRDLTDQYLFTEGELRESLLERYP